MAIALTIIGIALIIGGIFFPVPLEKVDVSAAVLTTVAGIPISNTLITGWISIIILGVVFWLATKSMKLVPTGVQNLAEWMIEGLLGLAESTAGRERGREFFALFATIFFYVLVNNWMELLPGWTNGTIFLQHGGEKLALFRSPSADMDFTLMLAIVSVVMTQFWAIKHTGVRGWLSKYFNLREGIVGFFVGLLEIVSELAKFISFSFRLFGNIFAGDILLAVIPFLVPWVVVLPFMLLETFVGAIQAFIFALLTLAFTAMVTSMSHHGGESEKSSS